MARITVEDCIDKFPSRFELVLVASNRARKLHSGENPTVEKDNDKNTVIALREIAQETLTIDQLKTDLVEEYQTTSFTEDENLDEDDDNNLSNNEEKDEAMIEDKLLNEGLSEVQSAETEEENLEIKSNYETDSSEAETEKNLNATEEESNLDSNSDIQIDEDNKEETPRDN